MKKTLLLIALFCLSFSANATQVEFLNAGVMDVGGKPLDNGYIYFYENTSGTTLKTIYGDYLKSTTLAQPLRTNSSGLPSVGGVPTEVFADGIYKIVVKNKSNVVVNTLQGMQYSLGQDSFGSVYVDILAKYGSNTTALQSAINDYPTANTIFLFKSGSFSVASNLVFLPNITVKVLKGAVFDISGGTTLTISGSVEALDYSIKTGAGNLIISTINNDVLRNSWYGEADHISMPSVSITGRYVDKSGLVMPVGSILPYGGITAPTGWFLCDGSTKSITTYADLYSVISGNFGISTNINAFYLPDLRGRFLRGLDSSTVSRDPDGLTRTAMNENGNVSRNIGSIQSDQLKAHTHYLNSGDIGSGTDSTSDDSASQRTSLIITQSTGGLETRPLNVYVNYIIKW